MYKKILVPVDLADESSWKLTLPVAIEFARLSAGTVVVVTVVRDSQAYWEGAYLPLAYEELLNRSEGKLRTIVSNDVPSDVSVSTTVGHGSVYQEILRIAEQEHADLILMAAHRPGIRDHLIGPKAARVVSHSQCSVLVVRGD
jgi:nucleotide-binding universal stress UspA family protein